MEPVDDGHRPQHRDRRWVELELVARSTTGEERRTIARAEAIRGPDGRVARLVGTFQDITQREQTRERLRLLSERLSLATSAAHIGVWEWNVVSGDLTWDDTMFSLYGEADDGRRVSFDLWKSKLQPSCSWATRPPSSSGTPRRRCSTTPTKCTPAASSSSSRSHGVETREWTYLRRDGRRVPVLLTVSTVRDVLGGVVGHLGVAIDLSERKAQERALLELNELLAERSRQKEVLLQEVHHRVKNNLQVIASLVNMQARQVDDAAARAALGECRNRIDTIAMIHEQLYQAPDYSRIPFSTYCQRLARERARRVGGASPVGSS